MTTSDVNLRVAAKAIITNEAGRILILREANTYTEGTNIGKFGLPGGRIEAAEPFFEGLAREVKEETGLTVSTGSPVHVDEWWPVIRGVKTHIVGMFIACKPTAGELVMSEEHDTYEWIEPSERGKYPLMESEARAIAAWVAALV